MKFVTRASRGMPVLKYCDGPANGPTLLLLHGVTRCWQDWETLLPALTSCRRVVALDQRGHGNSARASSYLVTDYIEDAIRFVRDQISVPLVILGHSLGAMVAAAVAAEVPQLVRGVVLEDPPFHTMGNRIEGFAWQALFIGMREATKRGGSVEELSTILSDIRLPVSGGVFKRLGELRDRASLEWSAKCLTALDPEVLTPVIEGRWLDGYHFRDVLSRIHCPVLLLQADPAAGGALTDADSDAARAALPSVQHVQFIGASHQLHRERTSQMLDAMHRFTASLSMDLETPF